MMQVSQPVLDRMVRLIGVREGGTKKCREDIASRLANPGPLKPRDPGRLAAEKVRDVLVGTRDALKSVKEAKRVRPLSKKMIAALNQSKNLLIEAKDDPEVRSRFDAVEIEGFINSIKTVVGGVIHNSEAGNDFRILLSQQIDSSVDAMKGMLRIASFEAYRLPRPQKPKARKGQKSTWSFEEQFYASRPDALEDQKQKPITLRTDKAFEIARDLMVRHSKWSNKGEIELEKSEAFRNYHLLTAEVYKALFGEEKKQVSGIEQGVRDLKDGFEYRVRLARTTGRRRTITGRR